MPVEPEEVPIGSDTGAETQRRFRYQAAYLSIVALDLVRSDGDLASVWCEHGDDGLVLRRDGRYVAYQVKTKASGQSSISATDDESVSAIRTFAVLEESIGDSIEAFVFGASIGFSTARKSSNLARFVAAVKAGTDPEAVDRYLTVLASKTGHDTSVVRRVLGKLRLDSGPGLTDVRYRLAAKLAELPALKEQDFGTCLSLADSITDAVQSASQLDHEAERRDVVAFMADPDGFALAERAKGKLITAETLNTIIAVGIPARLLEAPVVRSMKDLPLGSSRAMRKMLAGGVPAPIVNTQIDLRGAYEAEMLRRSERFDIERAEREAAHVELVLAAIGGGAHAAANQGDGRSFGRRMYSEVEARLRQRIADPQGYADLVGLNYEQLMGALTAVTDQCRVWWTDDLSFLDEIGEGG